MTENSQAETESFGEFYSLIAALLHHGRHKEILTICRYILNGRPDDTAAQFFVAKALQAEGESEAALECLVRIIERGILPPGFPYNLAEEARGILVSAVDCHAQYISSGKLQEVLQLTENMLRVSPNAKLFLESALSISKALGNTEKEATYSLRIQELNKAEHEQLQELATKYHDAGKYEDELSTRIAIFDHPYDLELHTAWRLQNIHSALGCIFEKPLDLERQQLAKKLIAAVPSPYDIPDPEKSDMLGRFDKFYRLSIKSIDIDAIHSTPVQSNEKYPMLFADSEGRPLTIGDIKQKITDNRVQVGFFAQATISYFKRYAWHYAESILKNSDISCLVFICATGAWDTAENAAKQIGIDDDRLIVCTDYFDDSPGKYGVYSTLDVIKDDRYPEDGTHYYAAVGLLYLDMFIKEFGIPMFLSGIDTVLQRGVREIVEKYHEADIVVNKLNRSGGSHLSSSLVNSLQLVYPTNNALLFAWFMKDQLGKLVLQKQQANASDQLFLFLAVYNLLATGNNPKVEYFEEFDVNNCMFNIDNVEAHRDHLSKFRFVNVFYAGQRDKSICGVDVTIQ